MASASRSPWKLWPSRGDVTGAVIGHTEGDAQTQSLELLDLREVQLDRGIAPEDVDENLELLTVGVDLFYLAGKVAERPLDDTDGVPFGPRDLRGLLAVQI